MRVAIFVKTDKWTFDSGASFHKTNNRDRMITMFRRRMEIGCVTGCMLYDVGSGQW